jgi:hypothetical protein
MGDDDPNLVTEHILDGFAGIFELCHLRGLFLFMVSLSLRPSVVTKTSLIQLNCSCVMVYPPIGLASNKAPKTPLMTTLRNGESWVLARLSPVR